MLCLAGELRLTLNRPKPLHKFRARPRSSTVRHMPASPTAARTATDTANGASPPPSPSPESPLAASREELNATLTYIRVTPNGRIAAAVGSGDSRVETDPGWEVHKEQARQAREGQETSSTPTRSPGEATDPPAQLEAEPAAVAEGGPGAGTETGGEEARPPSGAAVEAGGADGTEPEGQAAVDGVGAGAAEPAQPEQEPAAQEAADMPAAEKTVVEIDQPLALTLTGTSIIVTYAGVASNSAYLLPGGIGMKKGPHPKAELQFQQEFPLVYFKDATTLKDFVDKALGGRLELDALCCGNLSLESRNEPPCALRSEGECGRFGFLLPGGSSGHAFHRCREYRLYRLALSFCDRPSRLGCSRG